MSDNMPAQNVSANPIKNIHAHRLLWAGFIATVAEGMGFAIRGGILGQWSQQYGFTMTELG